MTIRIGKIKFELSFPLVAAMTAVIIYDTTLSVAICFISVMLHELGHIAALCHYGAMPEKIRLTLFDIAIVDKGKNLRSKKQDLVVVLAGVTVNFVIAAAAFLCFEVFGGEILDMIFYTNITLGCFNIMPVDSLDGGQALYLILSEKFPINASIMILDIISFIVLLPTACIGFIVLLQSKYNFTLLLTAVYLMAVIVLKNKKTV